MSAETLPPYLSDQEKLARWRKAVLAKGKEIAGRLERVLSGDEMDFDLSHIITLADAQRDTRKEALLRRYLAHINTIIQSFNQGRFGRCSVCQAPLPEIEIDETPWSDTCKACHQARP